ncbi:MAG: phosphatase PAP2 family protein [Oscillospiraceae bacterium]|nr:phosphatase PAP2 family protein [Oscillospiraceae bacterium]
MKAKKNIGFIAFSCFFYIVCIALMTVGSIYDLSIGKTVFDPENGFARLAESFGQFVYWGMWGPALTVIFLCRRDLNGNLTVIGKVFPFIKPVKDTESKAYKVLNIIVKTVLTVGFFVLTVVGWKKIIENVTKNILLELGKDDLSSVVYFIISAAVAVIGILLFSKINKNTLKKLEAAALAGVLFGIFLKIVEECKTITERVRIREMVAYSNGFLNDKGLSEGKYSPLTSGMAENTDFSAFTPWYKIGDDMGIYNRADSFPSGHTSYSCTLFISYIFCRMFEKLKPLAPVMLAVSAAYVAAMGYSRMIAGAHYLTDVAGAAMIGYTFFVIVKSLYDTFTRKEIIG